MEFKYITDEGFQEILKRDYIELKKCQEHKASKAVLLLCGSILEAVLTDYFCENLPAGKTKNNILEGTLSNLLDYAEDEKVINKSDKQLATVLKDYRNIIHPGREIRKKEVFDHRNSELAVSVLELLLAKIESKHKEKYDVEVEDILFNLDEDWNYRSIYSQVITRLNSAQRKELFQELLDLEMTKKSKMDCFEDQKEEDIHPNVEDVKELVSELKPLLSDEVIRHFLNELKKAISSAEILEAISLYNLLHEELHLLSESDQELIAVYMLSFYQSNLHNSKIFCFDKTYSTIGKYIHTQNAINNIQTLSIEIIVNHDDRSFNYEIDVFEQFINSFKEKDKNVILAHVQADLEKHREHLPPCMLSFAAELNKRGLINF